MMTSSKIQNGRKLDHIIQTTCQRFLSTTGPPKTISKVKMRVRYSAYSSAADYQTTTFVNLSIDSKLGFLSVGLRGCTFTFKCTS